MKPRPLDPSLYTMGSSKSKEVLWNNTWNMLANYGLPMKFKCDNGAPEIVHVFLTNYSEMCVPTALESSDGETSYWELGIGLEEVKDYHVVDTRDR